MRLCSDGCGKVVAHYAQECFPVAPWDTPDLPPRALADRCGHHRGLCAYRDDDPVRCAWCHDITPADYCAECEPKVAREMKRRATLAANQIEKRRGS